MKTVWAFFNLCCAVVVTASMLPLVLGDPADCKFSYPCNLQCSSGLNINLWDAERPLKTVSSTGQTYEIDPCGDPKLVPDCNGKHNDVIGCQKDGNNYYGIAQVNDYTADLDNEVVFRYHYTDTDNVLRKSEITVLCFAAQSFSFEKETTDHDYLFTLLTPEACAPSSSSGGISAGSVLLILFFVFVLIYLVGGVVFLKVVRKAEGLEAIPNYEFWKELPGLVKDGVRFTFRGCKAESTYEQI